VADHHVGRRANTLPDAGSSRMTVNLLATYTIPPVCQAGPLSALESMLLAMGDSTSDGL
jgi:hypothetical protein